MTRTRILSVAIQDDDDVVLARQRARLIAAAVGFDVQEQTRIATAVSELVRNVQQYAGHGSAVFELEESVDGSFLVACVTDDGPGIPHLQHVLEGGYVSPSGLGMGLVGARRLSDRFDVQSAPGKGTRVTIAKRLVTASPLAELARAAAAVVAEAPGGAAHELRVQNHQLLGMLDDLERQRGEADRLNAELEDTNRGVVALYAELDDRAQDLRRVSESKSRFLSMISHELRTPLTSVMNLSRLLLDRTDGELTAEQEHQILLIRSSVQSLTEMVNDLLDLAKIEAGKTTIRLAPIVVADLLATLRGVFRPVLHNAAVTLVVEDADPALTLCSDEAKVAQILRNFISNAVKFTEQGEIRVTMGLGDGDRIRAEVRDTGIGIAPEDQDAIFKEFIQVDSPRQRRVKGTGLGLSLSSKMAQMLGGAIGVQSEPGVGSTFWLVLPRVHPRAAAGCAEMVFEASVDRVDEVSRG